MLENWNVGMLENGMMESRTQTGTGTRALICTIIPAFQYSIIPFFFIVPS
jgi:hypothetical protein